MKCDQMTKNIKNHSSFLLHVKTIMMHVDLIYLACRGQKYVTYILNRGLSWIIALFNCTRKKIENRGFLKQYQLVKFFKIPRKLTLVISFQRKFCRYPSPTQSIKFTLHNYSAISVRTKTEQA